MWSNASWDMEVALNTAYLYKSFPFFATVIAVDDKNSSSYVVTVCMSHFKKFFSRGMICEKLSVGQQRDQKGQSPRPSEFRQWVWDSRFLERGSQLSVH